MATISATTSTSRRWWQMARFTSARRIASQFLVCCREHGSPAYAMFRSALLLADVNEFFHRRAHGSRRIFQFDQVSAIDGTLRFERCADGRQLPIRDHKAGVERF